MSKTISVGVVGPSYWSYMAAVMASCLGKIIATKQVEPEIIPKGVYSDAREFFRLVLQAAGDGLPDNPPASMNAYLIAINAVRSSTKVMPKTRRTLEECLVNFRSFVDRLQQPYGLTEEEMETAKSLRKFFLRLHQDGESEHRH